MILGALPFGSSPIGTPYTGAAFYSESLSDTFGLNDVLLDIFINRIVEYVAWSATHANTATMQQQVSDSYSLAEVTAAYWAVALTDGFGVNDTQATAARVIELVVDELVVSGIATSTLHAYMLLAESFAMDDTFRIVFGEGVIDGMSFDDTVAHILRALQSMSDAFGVDDSYSSRVRISVLVGEDMSFDDTAATTARLNELITETFPVFVTLQIDGGTYSGFVMNTATKGVTEYSNYPFESYAKIGKRYYGAAQNGVYLLEGDTDDSTPIEAYVRTAMLQVASGKQARMPAAYLGYTSSGQLVMKVVTTSEAGTKAEWWYELVSQTASAPREGRIKVGKGLKSVYWQFALSNKNGADFSLDVLKLWPMPLDRRI